MWLRTLKRSSSRQPQSPEAVTWIGRDRAPDRLFANPSAIDPDTAAVAGDHTTMAARTPAIEPALDRDLAPFSPAPPLIETPAVRRPPH